MRQPHRSVIQVERVFQLYVDGSLTAEAADQNPKAPRMPKTINKATGKESSYDNQFSEANWGDVTRGYRTVIDNQLRQSSVKTIMSRAREHYQETKKKALKSLTAAQPINVDSRTELVDLSD